MSPISAFTARRTRHLLLSAAILLASVLADSVVAPDAQAGTGACASDPVVSLSNNNVLDLHTLVGTSNTPVSTTDVSQVNYVLYGPQGTSVTTEVDGSILGTLGKDTFQYTANQAPNTYSVHVQVTGKSGMPVTASADLVAPPGKKVVSTAQANGSSPQMLQMGLTG
jgi:hypothetical protein